MQTNKSGKAKWNYIFIAATAGVMIWLLSQMQDPEQVWQTLRTADPRYLLADEITAMFDAVTQSQIWQALLHEAKERELGMVIVSHSESLLKRICTRRIDLKALQEKMAAV